MRSAVMRRNVMVNERFSSMKMQISIDPKTNVLTGGLEVIESSYNGLAHEGLLRIESTRVRVGVRENPTVLLNKEFFYLEFNNTADTMKVNSVLVKDWTSTIYVNRGGSLEALYSGKISKFDKEEVIKQGYVEYRILGNAASGVRKGIAVCVPTGTSEEFLSKLDKITCGLVSNLTANGLSSGHCAKAQARAYAHLAPMVNLGTISSYAIYMGKMANDLKDGFAYIGSRLVANKMSSLMGGTIRREDVVGTSLQLRPWSTKVRADVIKSVGRYIESTGIETVRLQKPLTKEEKILMTLGVNGKGEYANKIVVVEEKGEDVAFFSDLNGYKGGFDWNSSSGLWMLDMSKEDRVVWGASTSKQMLSTLVALDKEATNEALKGRLSESLTKEERTGVPSSTSLKGDVSDILNTFAPDYKDANLQMRRFNNTLEGVFNSISNMNIKVDGHFDRLGADIAADINMSFIYEGEIYSPAASKYFDNVANLMAATTPEEKECFIERWVFSVKYPKMGKHEIYVAKAVTLDTILWRIDLAYAGGKINKTQKEVYKDYYKDLKAGNAIMPASLRLMKFQAGLDFDWDGATIVFDPKLVVIAKKNKQRVVNIVAPELVTDDSKIYGADILEQAFRCAMEGAGGVWNTGVITNVNEAILGALSLIEAGDLSIATQMLAEFATNANIEDVKLKPADLNQSGKEYIELPYNSEGEVIVSNDTITEMKISMLTSDWRDQNNMRAIFLNLNDVYRFYQEGDLDSAKTGITVNVTLGVGEKFRLSSARNIKADIIDDKIVVKRADGSTGITYFQDDIESMRIPLAMMAKNKLQEELDFVNKDVTKVNKMEFNEFQSPLYSGRGIAGVRNSAINTMIALKNIYGDLVSVKIAALERIKNYEDQAAVNTAFKSELKAIRSMLKMIQRKLGISNVKMGKLGYFVSLCEMRGGTLTFRDDNKCSSFVYTLLKEEFMLYILDKYNKDAVVKDRLYPFYELGRILPEDGDRITLDNGKSKIFYSDSKLTGNFTLIKEDNKFYAEEKVSNLIEKEIESIEENLVTLRLSVSAAELKDARERLIRTKDVVLKSKGKYGIEVGEEIYSADMPLYLELDNREAEVVSVNSGVANNKSKTPFVLVTLKLK